MARIQATRLHPVWLLIAAGCVAVAALLGVLAGPISLSTTGILRDALDRLPGLDLTEGLSARDSAIVWQLRAPRVVMGAFVGAMLSLCGAAYQGAFRNPLADPYLLGVAAGAGLGATLAITYLPGYASWAIDPLPLAAFAGALLGTAATYALGRAGSRSRPASTLILAGVAMASFLTSVQTYVQQQQT